MVGVLITTHGEFASGIYESLRMVFGVNENVKSVNFTQDMSSEGLKNNLENVIDDLLSRNDGVICLTDIKGGTPFKTCAEISLKYPQQVSVISGTNLPMLISVVAEMEDITLEEAENLCIEAGKEQIEVFKLKKKEQVIEDDGI